MTEKQFWYDFEDCTGAKMIDLKNDKEYPLETIGDFREIEHLLNNFADENEQIKHTIQEAYNHERTALGKSILKQLLNNIGEI